MAHWSGLPEACMKGGGSRERLPTHHESWLATLLCCAVLCCAALYCAGRLCRCGRRYDMAGAVRRMGMSCLGTRPPGLMLISSSLQTCTTLISQLRMCEGRWPLHASSKERQKLRSGWVSGEQVWTCSEGHEGRVTQA